MTVFNQAPAQSADDLRTAKDLIDRAMDWGSTREGGGFWQDVIDALEDNAAEAEAMAQGQPSIHVPQPANVAPQGSSNNKVLPPLHTLVPGGAGAVSGKNPAPPTLPGLDQLVSKKRPINVSKGSAVSVTKEEIIHVYHNGQAVCGQVQGSPQNWPVGHFRVGLSELQKATCTQCVQGARNIRP